MTGLVVLAAGLGRRLAGHAPGPKWLAPVGADTPAARHLAAAAASGIERVIVVVSDVRGPAAAALVPWREQLDVELVANPRSADRNNWYSLLLGLERWSAGAGRDVAVLNSDLFAPVGWFSELLAGLGRCEAPAALVVDRSRPLTEEAMKVELDPAGRLARIGKTGLSRPEGEYVGLAWWSRPAVAEVSQVLTGFCDDPGRADHWYEHGIQVHLEQGGAYAAVPVPSAHWVEIDDPSDLQAARRLADQPHR